MRAFKQARNAKRSAMEAEVSDVHQGWLNCWLPWPKGTFMYLDNI